MSEEKKMDLYKNNMQWLERSQKDIFDFLMDESKQIVSDSEKKDFRVFEAKDGEKGFSITKDEKVYRLNSAYRPKEEAKRWAKQYKNENLEQIVFMYGLGNGMLANELYRLLKDDGKILVYEPDLESFKFVLENFDLTGLLSSERVRFLINGVNEQFLYNIAVTNIDYYNLKNIIICTHPQYDTLYPEEYSYFDDKLKLAIIEVSSNRNTDAYFANRRVENILHNLSYLDNSITLADLAKVREWEKDTAIIVAAGPSLDKNIKELKRAKGKAVIIATDTAIRYLVKENITPDFIVTVDAKKPVKYFSDYPEFSHIPLFCTESSNYEIMDFHKGKKIWFLCYIYLEKIYKRYNKDISFVGAGGCVANAAFSVCVELGIKRIILVGQDLAYEGDRTHAGDLKSHIFNEEETIKTVEGIDGNPVKTRADWDNYRIWFEEAIIIKPKIKVIDATEGGAKIKGAKIETLKEAIDHYCTEEIALDTLNREMPNSLNEQQLKDTYTYIEEQVEDLSHIKKIIDEIIETCNRVLSLMKKNPYANIENFSKKIMKNNDRLVKYDIMRLVIDYTCEETNKQLRNIFQMSEDEQENIRKTYETTKVTFECMLEGIDPVKKMLMDSIEKFSKK